MRLSAQSAERPGLACRVTAGAVASEAWDSLPRSFGLQQSCVHNVQAMKTIKSTRTEPAGSCCPVCRTPREAGSFITRPHVSE